MLKRPRLSVIVPVPSFSDNLTVAYGIGCFESPSITIPRIVCTGRPFLCGVARQRLRIPTKQPTKVSTLHNDVFFRLTLRKNSFKGFEYYSAFICGDTRLVDIFSNNLVLFIFMILFCFYFVTKIEYRRLPIFEMRRIHPVCRQNTKLVRRKIIRTMEFHLKKSSFKDTSLSERFISKSDVTFNST